MNKAERERGARRVNAIAAYVRRTPSLVYRHLTIVFDHGMGRRIREWRHRPGLRHPRAMKTREAKLRKPYLRQEQLAEQLGIFQQELADIERLEEGELRVCKKLDFLRFQSVFGADSLYIISGVGSSPRLKSSMKSGDR